VLAIINNNIVLFIWLNLDLLKLYKKKCLSIAGVFSKNYDKLYSNSPSNAGMPAMPTTPTTPTMPAVPTMPVVPWS
jgi:hypothetical protein